MQKAVFVETRHECANLCFSGSGVCGLAEQLDQRPEFHTTGLATQGLQHGATRAIRLEAPQGCRVEDDGLALVRRYYGSVR